MDGSSIVDSACTTSVRIDVSVIVPTHDRRERLRRVLTAFSDQQTDTVDGCTFTFEVIVVADGCTDGTNDMVRSLAVDYPLRLIEQDNSGPATARNRGVADARGETIVFIDDDVVAARGCLAAHVSRHRKAADVVVIGPMLTPPDVELSPWVAWEQHQLYKQYDRLMQGEPPQHRQFYTGNASLRRSAFVRAGGFDPALRRAEDVEFAHRLYDGGQAFVFEPAAEAFHHAERSLESWRQMAFDYGRHDVSFGMTRQPWVLDQIVGMFGERHPLQRTVVLLSLRRTRVAGRVQQLLLRTALISHRLRMVGVGRILLSGAYGLGYYSGVVRGLGSYQVFRDLLDGRRPIDRLSVVFVLEQTLGHVTHGKNLQSLVTPSDDVTPIFLPVDSSLTGAARRIPGWSNWTVRSGVRARCALRRLYRSDRRLMVDSMFVHSQVPAVLLGGWMHRIPTLVSLDATPEQYDELGNSYGHRIASRPVERVKHWLNRRCFRRARHLVTWSEWAKKGLVEQYGISPIVVTVIAPGVDLEAWSTIDRTGREHPVRILFVGADAERKGGTLLVEAARRLRADRRTPPFEVHMVTRSEIADEEWLHRHAGLDANDPALIEQYRLADIFCLPTFGDCLPMVLAEAGAAGLPLVSTDVGAVGELVRDGVTGRLIAPGDVDALVGVLAELIASPETRHAYGRAARDLVERDHDASRNADRIVSLLHGMAD